MPESSLADFGSVGGGAGCEVARSVWGSGRPAGPIKKKSSVCGTVGCEVSRRLGSAGKPASRFWQREQRGRVRGCPQCAGCRKRKGNGDARCAPARQGWAGAAAASVKVMEMHQGRRPVYGGAPQHPPKIAANATTRGVQGSRGPLVGGRRIETAGPLVLSVMKEQHSNEKL